MGAASRSPMGRRTRPAWEACPLVPGWRASRVPAGASVPRLSALTPHPASALCTLCRRGHQMGGRGPLAPGGHLCLRKVTL